MSGSNRRGKSDWLTTDCSLYMEGRHPFIRTPKRAVGWFVCVTSDMWGQVIAPKLRAKLKPNGYIINNQLKSLTITDGPGKGNKLFFKSDDADIKTFEGAKLNRAWVDEEISQQKFTALCVRTSDTNAQVLVAATLIGGNETYLYDDFIQPYLEGKARKDALISVGPSLDNATLDKKTIDELAKQVAREDELLARIRYSGEFLYLGGRCVFDGVSMHQAREKAVDPMKDFVIGGKK